MAVVLEAYRVPERNVRSDVIDAGQHALPHQSCRSGPKRSLDKNSLNQIQMQTLQLSVPPQ